MYLTLTLLMKNHIQLQSILTSLKHNANYNFFLNYLFFFYSLHCLLFQREHAPLAERVGSTHYAVSDILIEVQWLMVALSIRLLWLGASISPPFHLMKIDRISTRLCSVQKITSHIYPTNQIIINNISQSHPTTNYFNFLLFLNTWTVISIIGNKKYTHTTVQTSMLTKCVVVIYFILTKNTAK
jgi:hypothetical protein